MLLICSLLGRHEQKSTWMAFERVTVFLTFENMKCKIDAIILPFAALLIACMGHRISQGWSDLRGRTDGQAGRQAGRRQAGRSAVDRQWRRCDASHSCSLFGRHEKKPNTWMTFQKGYCVFFFFWGDVIMKSPVGELVLRHFLNAVVGAQQLQTNS